MSTPRNRLSSRKGKASFLLFVLTIGAVSSFALATPKPAYAQYVDPITSIQTTVSNVWSTLKEGLVQGAGVAILNGANYFLQQLAYQAAVALTSDCPGQVVCWDSKSFEKGFEQAWQGAIGEAVGTLSAAGGFDKLGFNLCKPPTLNNEFDFSLNIQLGLLDEVKPPAPKCDWNALKKNYSDAASSLTNVKLLTSVSVQFTPGQAPLSAGLKARGAILDKAAAASAAMQVKSLTDASAGGGFSGITDKVSGRVKSPPAVTSEEFKRSEKEGKGESAQAQSGQVVAGQLSSKAIIGVVLSAVQSFAMTLITRLFNKLVKGLMSTEQLVAGQPDIILSREGLLTAPGQRQQEESLKAQFTFTPPRDVGAIDPLLDFTVCPTAGRTSGNCVVDAQFANAVRVADAAPLTVRDAIQKGMLHGDWPLIPESDQIHDQDPFCYTYGYCQSNLKKLRAARIISVGWEIAASVSSPSQPVKLKDAVDRFNDCNSSGKLDPTHPFCHLIDPAWVLKMPPAQCHAKVFGPNLLDSQIPTRTESCVDQPTCLQQDDQGNCTGGWGYCMRERNVWRFNGDNCPAQYNSCRTLTPKDSADGEEPQQINYLLNTIDYGICNADNTGCAAFSTTLNTAGSESNLTDDWMGQPALYFNKSVAACSVDKVGCGALVALGRTDSLNLVKNGGFEALDDGDADGNGDHPTFWLPVGRVPVTSSGFVSTDGSKAADGLSSVFLSGSNGGNPTKMLDTCNLPLNACVGGTNAGIGCSVSSDCSGGGACVATGGTCLSDSGCTCNEGGFTCKVNNGATSCAYTNQVMQDHLPIIVNKTYTLAATFLNPSSSATSADGIATLHFEDAVGARVTVAAADVNLSSSSTCTVVTLGTDPSFGGIKLQIGSTTQSRTRGSCTFVVKKAGIIHASLRLHAASGKDTYADDIQLEEGGGAPYHEEYGAAGTQALLKVPPKYLGCTGDATDRPECASFAGVCRENEVGCDLYTPKNGDPAVPGITGPQDFCPAACVGYDAFKQEGTEFEKETNPPTFVYFIPKTAKQCSVSELGCSEFTNLDTEGVEYFTKLRLCQRPDDPDSKIFYSWEGSDTTGYQLKVWNLKQTLATVANNGTNDVCANSADPLTCAGNRAGKAPCTQLDASNNTCVDAAPNNPESLCSRAEIDFGDFDCREFYDADGNRHYRQLSRTILATQECHPYRITKSTQNDCQQTNGKWDGSKFECVYQASGTESNICAATSKDCRAYKGNAATNVRNAFIDDFENGLGSWKDTAGGATNIELSSESITVGGHSLKVKANAPFTTLRDVTDDVGPGRSYQVSLWARGSGKLSVKFVPGAPVICDFGSQCTNPSGCTCSVPDRGSCLVSNLASTCTPPGPPNVGIAPKAFSDAIESPAAGFADAPTLALTSNWKQFTFGPVIVTSPLWTNNKINLSIQSNGSVEYYLDNIQLKQAADNILVVRGSWVTPASCDQTIDGAPSPLEMLGCREYTDTRTATVNLRSFSQLCREKAVGCAAFSATQNTVENPYEESFNAVCSIPVTCGTAPSCVCDYDLKVRPDSAVGAAFASPPAVLHDVCRVPVGETECRFNLDRWDDSSLPSQHPDRVNIAADERLFLVATKENQCEADAIGCKNLGTPHTAFDAQCTYMFPKPDINDIDKDGDRGELKMQPGQCDPTETQQSTKGVCSSSGTNNGNICGADSDCGSGLAKCSKFRVDANTCRCTDAVNAASCTTTKGGTSCSVSYETGVTDKWKASTLKDEPKTYEKTLCLAAAVGCGEFSSSTGTIYFKDPGDKICQFKENVQYKGASISGWFRKSASGALIPCAAELLKNGDQFEIYHNKDESCSIANACADQLGCLCAKGTRSICRVPVGEKTCGFEGWTGECKPQFDRCEEFRDPAATSPSNPAGQPYYYLMNDKLDTKSCSGSVSIKQGCVLLNQTSNTQQLYASTASYLSSIRSQGEKVSPLNCNQGQRSGLCESRCQGVRSSRCSNDAGKSCTVDSDCGAGTCLGDVYYGAACEISKGHCSYNASIACTLNSDCSSKVCMSGGRINLSCTVDGDCTGGGVGSCQANRAGCVNSDCNVGEVCKRDNTTLGSRVFTNNDTNLVVKVRPDRECAEWLTCRNADFEWDDQAGHYQKVCTGFGLCDHNNQVGQTFECASFVDEKASLFSNEKYSARDTTWGGLDYSGYSLPRKYPAQFLAPLNIAASVCLAGTNIGQSCAGNADCPGSSCAVDAGICVFSTANEGKPCSNAADCGGGTSVCSKNYLRTRRFAVMLNNIICRTDADCPTDETGTGSFSRGKCVEHRCAYDFAGGKLRIDGVAGKSNAPECRGYPEADAPYPKDVLDDSQGGGYDGFGNAYTKKASFKGATVCARGNDCECAYNKNSYGAGGGFVRYNSTPTQAPAPNNVYPGVCTGGPYEGKECTPGVSFECGTLDQGGTCSRRSRQSVSLGWPGFCIDHDQSFNINGNQETFACNLWLPVDKLSGAPDIFNQFTEAGFEMSDSSSDLMYCQVAIGNKSADPQGASYVGYGPITHAGFEGAGFGKACSNGAFFAATTPSGGCTSLTTADSCNGVAKVGSTDTCVWQNNQCVDWCTKDSFDRGTGGCIFNSADGCYRSIRNACDTSGTPQKCNQGDCKEFPPATGTDTTSNRCQVPPTRNYFDVSWEDSRRYSDNTFNGILKEQIVAVEILFYNSWIGDNSKQRRMYLWPGNDFRNGFSWYGSNSDELPQTTNNSYKALSNKYELQGDGASAKCFAPEGDLENDCSPNGGGNCLSARLVFSGTTATHLETTLCANDSTFGDHVSANALIYYREACSNVTRLIKQENTMKGAAWTDELNRLKRTIDGMTYAHSTDRPNYTHSLDLAPYGYSYLRTPNTLDNGPHIKVTPVWSSEGGSPYTQMVLGSDAYSLTGGDTVAGRPFSCTGNCNAPNKNEGGTAESSARGRINQLFAVIWDAWTWDRGGWNGDFNSSTYEYELAGDWRAGGNFDTRAIKTSDSGTPTGVPKVRPAEPPCPSEGVCHEGTAAGITVCLNSNCTVVDKVGTTSKTKVDIKYYAFADKNHMPIRRKILDFGDGSPASKSGDPSFFKNHRGTDGTGAPICGTTLEGWGTDNKACDPRFFMETHTYICNEELISGNLTTPALPTCSANNVYPCQSTCPTSGGICCRFKPRVQVMDNWGICNGTCPGQPGNGSVCMQTTFADDNPLTSECTTDIHQYTHGPDPANPYGSLPATSGFKNNKKPWDEFGAEIIVPKS